LKWKYEFGKEEKRLGKKIKRKGLKPYLGRRPPFQPNPQFHPRGPRPTAARALDRLLRGAHWSTSSRLPLYFSVTRGPRTSRSTAHLRFPRAPPVPPRMSRRDCKLRSPLMPSRLQILEPTSPAGSPITPPPVLHAFRCATASLAEKLKPPPVKLTTACCLPSVLGQEDHLHLGKPSVPSI
jgi:hypothetical protein